MARIEADGCYGGVLAWTTNSRPEGRAWGGYDALPLPFIPFTAGSAHVFALNFSCSSC